MTFLIKWKPLFGVGKNNLEIVCNKNHEVSSKWE